MFRILLAFCIVLGLQPVQHAQGRPFVVDFPMAKRQLLQAVPADASTDTNLEATESSLVAHECLWSSGTAGTGSATALSQTLSAATTTGDSTAQAATTATAVATATATTTASATATATAAASVDASASSEASATADYNTPAAATAPKPRAQCTLNPSYFFSLPTPVLDGELLLLEITAMRYGCLNHTSFATCAADQANWCTWHEDRSRCEMSYADADFVHLLLWSRTKIACKGSKLEQVVTCSYITSDTDCTGECAWAEGACYPAWYAPLVNKPQSIQSFKRQLFTGDPVVWGTCAGADLYKTYSSICNYGQDECVQDPQCQWVPDFETQALPNPLNFTKPCLLSTTKFSVESVFLSFNSEFSTAVISAQQDCIRSRTQKSCIKKQVELAPDVLDSVLNYTAATAPATGTAPSPGSSAVSNNFKASWAQIENLPVLHPAAEVSAAQGQAAAPAGNDPSRFDAAEWESRSPTKSTVNSYLPEPGVDPSKLSQAGVTADGQPAWFIQPCSTPAACTSAFTALGLLHVVNKAAP